jgi:hypothetical protein
MIPISDGAGPERYTLYFPILFSERKGIIDIVSLTGDISAALGKPVEVIVRDKDFLILRVRGHAAAADTEVSFRALRRFCDALVVETRIPIHTYDTLLAPQSTAPLSVSVDWPAAVAAGWRATPGETVFLLDAMVNIVFPCVVAEHHKVVDAGALRGRLMMAAKPDAIERALPLLTPTPIQGEQNGQDRNQINLAMQAYIAALQNDDAAWKLHCYVTCLETLATRDKRPTTFQSALDLLKLRLAASVEGDHEVPEIAAALDSALRAIDDRRYLSSGEAIARLLVAQSDAILAALPGDHPARATGLERWAKRAYSLRSKVAHRGGWGEFIGDDEHRALQLAEIAASVVLKATIAAEQD